MTLATTLTAAVAAGDTSIPVASADDWPQAQFFVAVNGERLLVQEGFGTTTWGVQRDQSAAPTILAEDRFQREEVDTLGQSDGGIDWRADNSDASANVNVLNGVATIELLGPSEQKSPILGYASELNGELRFRFMFDKLPVGGDMDVTARLRMQENANKDRYRLRALIEAGGDIVVRSAIDGIAGTTQLGSNVTHAGLAVVDTWYIIAFQAVGASPTTLNGKVWKESDGEPAGWDLSVTDSTAALQVAGEPAMRAGANAGVSNAPILDSFADFVFSRAATGRAHASGSVVSLIEPWDLPIVVQPGVGAPIMQPDTGAWYVDTSVSPPVVYIRVGAGWWKFGTLTAA